MRQFIIMAAIACGLVALWAAIVPLTAQPAPPSPVLAKALFLCRGPHGLDSACAAALAKALVLDPAGEHVSDVSARVCPVGREALARLAQQG